MNIYKVEYVQLDTKGEWWGDDTVSVGAKTVQEAIAKVIAHQKRENRDYAGVRTVPVTIVSVNRIAKDIL
jgi:hypothetical protein